MRVSVWNRFLPTNAKGFTLVGALIAASVIGVVGLSIASILSNVSQHQKLMAQKFDAMTLQVMLTQMISLPEYCTSQLRDTPDLPRKFNALGVTTSAPSPTPIDLGLIRTTSDPASPVLAQSGQPLPNSSLIIDKVQLANIMQFSANRYIGELQVTFSNKSQLARRALTVPGVLFDADVTDPTKAAITNCLAPTVATTAAGQHLVVTQEYPSGQNGGDINTNVWYTRDLNTVRENSISGAQLIHTPRTVATQKSAQSRIRLPAGTYYLRARVHGDTAGDHVAKWYNVTDGKDVLIGTIAFAHDGQATESYVVGTFKVDAPTEFELQHRGNRRCATAQCCQDASGQAYCSTQGGNANYGVPEVYATLEIQKTQ